jgi:UDP-glucuronate decarboxylase
MIKAIQKAMKIEDFFGPVNLGSPVEITIQELAEKILKTTKSKSKISYNKLPSDDPIRRCPDISLAKKMLNWEPETSLDEGLEKTIQYFREKFF